ncbi:hypothetical protein AHF37_11815 [Paragonimus kellicotti]|nr:hypothetical protein AHF37_11815 [Paragonimus kellicotti]
MRCDTSQTQRKMRAVPVVISLLVLLDGALAQAESAPKTLSSVFSGFLYYNLSWIRNTSSVVMENKTMQVQTDVCSQITSLVPWYQALKNGSTCTVTIGEQRDEKSDGRSADTTTASPAPEQTSTSSGFVTTVRTTTRGGVARITWRLASMIPLLLTFSALLAML